MAALPQWFGPPERRLFGWVHVPDAATSRGLVVLCPSMGQEAIFAYFTLRALANRLAELGFVAVRFDYDGTGESVGSYEDPDRVPAWIDSVDAAVALGRAHTAAPLTLLGFRLGALIATAAAARRDDVEGLVLWDSPRNGRTFLRERAIQQNVSVGGADFEHGTFTALGLSVTEQTQGELRGLDLRGVSALPAPRVLVLDRPGAPGPGPSVATSTGEPVDRAEATDQDDLLFRQALPRATERRVLDWLGAAFPDRPDIRWPLSAGRAPGSVDVIEVPGGTERIVEVGPARLFGLLTEPARPAQAPTVVFVPDSFTPRSGLSRIWTDSARAWAADGVSSLRFDLNGCADSEARPGDPSHHVGVLSHLDDVHDAIDFAGGGDARSTFVVGLCSGAYLSLEGALENKPRGIALVNPIFSFITTERRPSPRRRAIVLTRRLPRALFGRLAGRIAERLSKSAQIPAFMNDPNFAWRRALEACFWKDYLVVAGIVLPEWLLRLANRLLSTRTQDAVLRTITAQGTSVMVIAGDPDFEKTNWGARRQLARLEKTAPLQLMHLPGLDHAMMRAGTKESVAAALTQHVLELRGDTAPSGAGGAAVDRQGALLDRRPGHPVAETSRGRSA